jgi:hypothetical protein
LREDGEQPGKIKTGIFGSNSKLELKKGVPGVNKPSTWGDENASVT